MPKPYPHCEANPCPFEQTQGPNLGPNPRPATWLPEPDSQNLLACFHSIKYHTIWLFFSVEIHNFIICFQNISPVSIEKILIISPTSEPPYLCTFPVPEIIKLLSSFWQYASENISRIFGILPLFRKPITCSFFPQHKIQSFCTQITTMQSVSSTHILKFTVFLHHSKTYPLITFLIVWSSEFPCIIPKHTVLLLKWCSKFKNIQSLLSTQW